MSLCAFIVRVGGLCQMRQHGESVSCRFVAVLNKCQTIPIDSASFRSGSAGLELAAGKDGKAVDSKEGHYSVGCLH